jgi:hypothetical protein
MPTSNSRLPSGPRRSGSSRHSDIGEHGHRRKRRQQTFCGACTRPRPREARRRGHGRRHDPSAPEAPRGPGHAGGGRGADRGQEEVGEAGFSEAGTRVRRFVSRVQRRSQRSRTARPWQPWRPPGSGRAAGTRGLTCQSGMSGWEKTRGQACECWGSGGSAPRASCQARGPPSEGLSTARSSSSSTPGRAIPGRLVPSCWGKAGATQTARASAARLG